MTELLSAEERAAIAAAITEAERGTAGEIRVVVTTRPLIRHPFYTLMWATLAALVAPWPLAVFTTLDVPELLSVQAATFVVVGAALMLTPLGALCVPGVAKEAAARAAAIDHFLAHGVHQTAERTGVLILVALPEHVVEVVADEGIHSKVGHDAWHSVCATVLAGARAGRLTEGISAGVREAGALLATHAPPRPGDTNELADRVIVV